MRERLGRVPGDGAALVDREVAMDIVSVLLGILMFAILISLVYGIDRI